MLNAPRALWVGLAAVAVGLAVFALRHRAAPPRKALVTVLFESPAEAAEPYARRVLEPAAKALGCSLVVDGRRGRVCDGAEAIELELREGAFAQLGHFNWKAWPKGEALSGLAIVILAGEREASPAPAPWAPNGALRRRTRLSALLARTPATGVIVDVIGGRAWAAEDWLTKVGDPEDPASVAVAAYTDIGPASDDPSLLILEGPGSAGLPDIYIETAAFPENDRWTRGGLAGVWLYRQMLDENRPPADGALVQIPLGAEVPATSLDLAEANPDLDLAPRESWRVRYGQNGRSVYLSPEPARPLLPSAAEYLPYRLYMKLHLPIASEIHLGRLAGMHPPVGPPGPAYEVFAFPAKEGVLVTTLGLGRWEQPGGSADQQNVHVELALPLPRDSYEIADALNRLGALYSGREDEAPWGPWHRVAIEGLGIGPAQYPWVVLRPAFDLPAPPGDPIHFWSPLLVTQAERDAVPVDELQAWLTDERAAQLYARWLEPR